MSAVGFAIGFGLIVLFVIAVLAVALVWAEREPLDDEPTEHGKREP